MEYHFNNLNPTSFQRVINGLLVARYGEDARLTPLRGADGGRDAETAPGNPYHEYIVSPPKIQSFRTPPRAGRYLFQVKHHRTLDVRPSDARTSVVSDFERELRKNVLTRSDDERVNYFFLLTNVPSSRDAILAIDQKRRELLKDVPDLHADVWWQEGVVALLDQTPALWASFPEMFPGGKVPFLAEMTKDSAHGLPRAIRVAIGLQYQRDSLVKFKQIDLEKSLTKLFVDLNVDLRFLEPTEAQVLVSEHVSKRLGAPIEEFAIDRYYYGYAYHQKLPNISALSVLMNENSRATSKLLIEGGPGQGKSTITQMLAQIYRNEVLSRHDLDPEGRWFIPAKKRMPFRIELRSFGEWLADDTEASVEQYLTTILQKDSGGSVLTVDDIHNIVEHSPILLIFDGLDEVGSAELRDSVLLKIAECVERFETALHSDLRVIVTTRPPAIAGRREQLVNFTRLPIAPMEPKTVEQYLDRWLTVQVWGEDDRKDIRNSFEARKNETHVAALIKNPMQLSVLLHFIRLKGEAFPDRRAELYRDYFRTVIDRDVEKSPELRQKREIIETLHQLLGYRIHSLTEADKADGTLKRAQLLQIVEEWMRIQTNQATSAADEIFRLGEERLGLIVALRGEGEEARYGYEIQPIREYFAAAYINEQIHGNSHDVFEALITRAYWKEVALFLAGLRRPNEKADLITRAKAVEREPESNWRHDGRAIVLQLLQEGVFSQPPHVFNDGLEFVIDFLDPAIVSVPNDPMDLLGALPPLISQGDRQHHIDRLLRIADTYSKTDDVAILHRIYYVLGKLLPPSRMREFLLQYQGSNENARAKVRLLWASLWGVEMGEAASRDEFWAGLSEKAIATSLWRAALITDTATNIPFPKSIHQRLFEKYALSSRSIIELATLDRPETIKPRSNWAIWRLISLQQMLLTVALTGKSQTGNVADTTRNPTSFDGLELGTAEMITVIIPLLERFVVAISDRSRDASQLASDYVTALSTYLNRSGITGLIAARTYMYLVESYRLAAQRRFATEVSPNLVQVLQQSAFSTISSKLLPFYGFEHEVPTHSYFASLYHRPSDEGEVPTHFRAKDDGPFEAITTMIANDIRLDTTSQPDWIGRVPINSSTLRPLVDECSPHFEQLLAELSTREFEYYRHRRPLLVQKTQRILKLARSSKEPKLLEGALVALSTSKFLNLAGSELTVKLLRAVKTQTSVAHRLFTMTREDQRQLNVLTESATHVIKNPSEFRLAVRIAAANYLADHQPVHQGPLLDFEETLGLQMQNPNTVLGGDLT